MKITRSAIYVHKSNILELLVSLEGIDRQMVPVVVGAKEWADAEGLDYEVVKYSPGRVSLITSPDWDSAPEPLVGTSYIWIAGEQAEGGGYVRTKQGRGRYVWHMKELFVAPDYGGFDVEAARARTRMLSELPPPAPHRQGHKSYWEEYLRENGVARARRGKTGFENVLEFN